MASLTKEEKSFLESYYKELSLGVSDIAKGFRKEFFNPKQKLSHIRWWFDRLPGKPLTDEELSIIKKIIVKPKSTQWTIVRDIMKYQKQLSGDQIKEWFETVRPLDRRSVSMTFIMDKRVTDIPYKMELVVALLKHVNYIKGVIEVLDRELGSDTDGIYPAMFTTVVDFINGDNANSELVADWWASESTFLDLYAMHRDIVSQHLYEKTGKEQYLPQTAKDVFLF